MKDGWHVISGQNVYVERDHILRGVKNNLTVWPYRWNQKYNSWINETGISVNAFRSAVSRGTVRMF